jgi:hypothetical protein
MLVLSPYKLILFTIFAVFLSFNISFASEELLSLRGGGGAGMHGGEGGAHGGQARFDQHPGGQYHPGGQNHPRYNEDAYRRGYNRGVDQVAPYGEEVPVYVPPVDEEVEEYPGEPENLNNENKDPFFFQ